ncbi:MAG: hypothetical protein HWN65_06810 [Candidatus Helarchaeota archaeon]|nr:hypothetical protein [Candidatus Helarchaeota archaeon]
MSDALKKSTKARKVLGSGDKKKKSQSFKLVKEYSTSTTDLQIYVDNSLWTRVNSFSRSRSNDRHYIVRIDENGTATVQFGDGVKGARLPTGTNNVVATYRTGAGTSGNVPSQKAKLKPKPISKQKTKIKKKS